MSRHRHENAPASPSLRRRSLPARTRLQAGDQRAPVGGGVLLLGHVEALERAQRAPPQQAHPGAVAQSAGVRCIDDCGTRAGSRGGGSRGEHQGQYQARLPSSANSQLAMLHDSATVPPTPVSPDPILRWDSR